MTKEEWKRVRRILKDAARYANDAAKNRGGPTPERARVMLDRIKGALHQLDRASAWLTDYLHPEDQYDV